jgi:hypothetical protein
MPQENNGYGQLTPGLPKAEGLMIAVLEQGTHKVEKRNAKDGREYDSHVMNLRIMHKSNTMQIKGRFKVTVSGDDGAKLAATDEPQLVMIDTRNDYYNIKPIGLLSEFQAMATELGA